MSPVQQARGPFAAGMQDFAGEVAPALRVGMAYPFGMKDLQFPLLIAHYSVLAHRSVSGTRAGSAVRCWLGPGALLAATEE